MPCTILASGPLPFACTLLYAAGFLLGNQTAHDEVTQLNFIRTLNLMPIIAHPGTGLLPVGGHIGASASPINSLAKTHPSFCNKKEAYSFLVFPLASLV
jgi:hypothetical protein